MRHSAWLVVLALAGCEGEKTVLAVPDYGALDAALYDAATGRPLADGGGPDEGVIPDAAPDAAVDADVDAEMDAEIDAAPLATRALVPAPTDPLADRDVESCATWEATRCVDGRAQTCALYTPETAEWVAEPDPRFARALRFERWYAAGHSPDGQTAERRFDGAMPPGTPEAEWLDPERFARYAGWGDSAIWTGVALHAYALRYAETGTAADYDRMVAKARALLLNFEVTGVQGYLARAHFGAVAPGTAVTDTHLISTDDPGADHRYHPFDPAQVPSAPAVYTDGYVGTDGEVHPVVPWWLGNPSIDQYTGPMTAFPVVADLLRPEDAPLREALVGQLTCYLKRLERIELINAQANPEVIELFQQLLGGGRLVLDPEDPDFGTLDTIVGYGLRQLNSTNAADFEYGCPDTIELVPTRVIDLAEPTWLPQMLGLVQDLQSRDNERPNGYDHFYAPSVRAGDAMHLMHLAAIGWRFTGEAQYRRFFHETLVQDLNAMGVIGTAAALYVPDWCRAFYGGHITYPAYWSTYGLLDDEALRAPIAAAMHGEFWARARGPLADLKFDLMFASMADPWPADRDAARARAVAQFDALGGNGGQLDDPRRAYPVPVEVVTAVIGEDGLRCPTVADREACEAPIAFMGIEFPGESITHDCGDGPLECAFEDGQCAEALAAEPLPLGLRPFTDFLWQRNPFEVGYATGTPGHTQSPGLDVIEAFWLARHLGVLDAGAGQVLAWRDTEGACP